MKKNSKSKLEKVIACLIRKNPSSLLIIDLVYILMIILGPFYVVPSMKVLITTFIKCAFLKRLLLVCTQLLNTITILIGVGLAIQFIIRFVSSENKDCNMSKKFITYVKMEIKKHEVQCVKICWCIIYIIIIFNIKNALINFKGFSAAELICIIEALNLIFIYIVWIAICQFFGTGYLHVIKKQCSSFLRMLVFALLGVGEVIFSGYIGYELARIVILFTCLIIFIQLWRDRQGKNDESNCYNDVPEYLNNYGPPAIELLVIYIVRLAEIGAEIGAYASIATIRSGSTLNPEALSQLLYSLNVLRQLLYMMTFSLYVTVGAQTVYSYYWQSQDKTFDKQLTMSLKGYVVADVLIFTVSIVAIISDIKADTLDNYAAASYLLFSFLFTLIIWFCYFSYCGWLLKKSVKSLDYEFWTLLIKSILKACIAFALIENQLPATKGLGTIFTAILATINSFVITFYPMLDMYKFVRKGLEKSIK